MEAKLQTKKQKEPSKKERLLANPNIKRWYDNVARGSPITADVWLRRLSKFCEVHQMTPMELAEFGMKDLNGVTDLLQDHITWMEQQGYAPQYIAVTMVALKGWLRHFDVEIKRKLRIRNQDTTPTLDGERIPEADETAEIFNRADLRAGAIISLIAKAGLRPEVLGMHDASDGLKIKDLPDLAIIQGLATFTRTPARIMVRKSLSKAGHEYMTFLTTEGCKKLLAYLNDRIINGESLGPEDAVIAPLKKHTKYRGNNEGKKHLSTPLIERAVRKILRPRFDWRPYVFRRFFDTRLLIAESRGKVAHDFRVFWMGHKGSIEAVYTTNKGILPQSLLEEMREAFRRSEELLDIEKTEEDSLENQKRALQEKVAQMTPEEVQELLRLLGSCESSGSSQAMMQSSSSKRVGNMQELYLTARSSSKNKIWTSRVSGPGGTWTHIIQFKTSDNNYVNFH